MLLLPGCYLILLWYGMVCFGVHGTVYIEVRDQVEMGDHTFWPNSLDDTFFKKYFTMNSIHDIPETNGSHSQHLDRAFTSRFLEKI